MYTCQGVYTCMKAWDIACGSQMGGQGAHMYEDVGIVPYTSYISRVLYFVETGKSVFYRILVVFIFAERYMDLVPRLAESNFHSF